MDPAEVYVLYPIGTASLIPTNRWGISYLLMVAKGTLLLSF
jgi:hypothetical protein